MPAPTLTGFGPLISFAENTVNAGPQLLDPDVSFADADEDFTGGRLTLSGLLAEDRVSVRNEGNASGQIGLSGTNVTYGGVVIGTIAGGFGVSLVITFNAAATSAAIDALIQNLTYANVSNTPTATRNLILNVTDAAGGDLNVPPGTGGQTITVTVNAENDVPTAPGLPNDVSVTEDVTSDLDLSAVTITDVDTAGPITVVLTASAGIFTATTGGGVSVTNSGTGAITLVGTASAIDNFLNTASSIRYTSAPNASGDNAATITVTANDGSGFVTLGTVNVDITGINDLPTLTGFGPSIIFGENTVNTIPQVLDADVSFADIEGSFGGGSLTLSGLLAEDRVSVRNEGAAPGQIGLSGSNVTFGGQVIGTMAGGNGATLTVTFNAAATSAAIDALIQNLTYANASNAPTMTRELRLNITDSAGGDLVTPSYTATTGAANPFNGIDVGVASAPAFVDLDGDGDQDLVLGSNDGTLLSFRNGGVGSSGAFSAVTGAANPFDGIDVGTNASPTFVDLDGDGDLDLVVGAGNGVLLPFRNGTVGTSGAFTAFTGASNPFSNLNLGGGFTRPMFVDLDGDGDLDLAVGTLEGTVAVFRNGTVGAPGSYSALVGTANPFNGIDVGLYSAPAFIDLDGDGDLDLVSGAFATVQAYRNGTVGMSGAFTAITGASNPFNAITPASMSFSGWISPAFVDLDGDGDLDLVLGDLDGTVRTFITSSPGGRTITVTVNAENDAPIASGLPTDLIVTRDVTSDLDLSAVTITDVDTAGPITVVLTASAGILTATTGGGVSVTNSGTGAITLVGTASAIDNFLNTASSIRYTSAPNASGDNAATITVTANDGSGFVTLGTVNVDITSTLVSGTDGNDIINGTSGSDTINAGAGNDILNGGAGNDALNGGSGIDTAVFSYNRANAIITYENGSIIVSGAEGRDVLSGIEILQFAGSTFDVRSDGQVASQARMTLTGTVNPDIISGGDSNDALDGGAGNDTLTGGLGNDALVGGAGIDTAVFGYSRNLAVISYENGAIVVSGTEGRDVLTGIEALQFSDGYFVVTPEGLVSSQAQGAVIGTSASDILNSRTGGETISGGSGFDAVIYEGVVRQYVSRGGASTSVTGGPEGGVDTLIGIEEARFVDGILTFDASSASAQVMRLYSATLNRVPDQGGLEANVGALGTLGLQGLANTFVASAEFQARFGALNNQQFVEQLYLFALGRTGDGPGIASWVGLLNGGASRGQVVVGFSESAENIGRTAATLNAGLWVPDQQALIIARLYDATFDRLPDVLGLAGWVNALKGGTSLTDIAGAFANSSEFQERYGALSDQAFVEQLYRFCLNRDGDPSGIANWVAALTGGASRASVLLSFSESAEHIALTAPSWLGGINCFGFFVPPAGLAGPVAMTEAEAKDIDAPLVLPDREGVLGTHGLHDIGLSVLNKAGDAFVLPAFPDGFDLAVDPADPFNVLDLAALRAEAFSNGRMMLILPETPEATPDFDLDAWTPAQRDGYWLM